MVPLEILLISPPIERRLHCHNPPHELCILAHNALLLLLVKSLDQRPRWFETTQRSRCRHAGCKPRPWRWATWIMAHSTFCNVAELLHNFPILTANLRTALILAEASCVGLHAEPPSANAPRCGLVNSTLHALQCGLVFFLTIFPLMFAIDCSQVRRLCLSNASAPRHGEHRKSYPCGPW